MSEVKLPKKSVAEDVLVSLRTDNPQCEVKFRGWNEQIDIGADTTGGVLIERVGKVNAFERHGRDSSLA
jgi:hypothetical protein